LLKIKIIVDDKNMTALIKKSVAIEFSTKPSGSGIPIIKKTNVRNMHRIELIVKEKNE
tara:strand:- start:3260 stop:3433 length:174 start_codon:yes stop_codon:yes gene_type:complete